MHIDVSVIIPCYNCSGTLSRAVGSVAAQTSLPQSVVLVDDGTMDDTREAIAAIQSQYGRKWIRCVRLAHNQGPAAARNEGWSLCSSRYVAFLDADDAWHRDKLTLQYEWMVRNPEYGLTGHRADFAPSLDSIWSPVDCASLRHSAISFPRLLISNVFCTSSVAMVRNDIGIRFRTSFRYSQDYMLWLEIVSSGVRAALLGTTLSFYFKRLYGESGQTANLKNATDAEHAIYRTLREEGRLDGASFLAVCILSNVRYYRRLYKSRRWGAMLPYPKSQG